MNAALGLARALASPRPVTRAVPARIRAACLRGAIAWLLRRGRLDEVLDAVASAGGASPRRDMARRPVRAADAVAQLRGLPVPCLSRALAAYAALRSAGEDVTFLIGVRGDGAGVVAHAWIEQAGSPVGEPSDPRRRFAVAYVHPAPSGAAAPQEECGMPSRRPGPEIVLTRLADGSGVLLHLGTKFYYALNPTGVVAWELLSGSPPAGPDAIAEAIAARFAGVDRVRARADVEALLRELEGEGLLAAG